MMQANPRSIATIRGIPIHAILVPFPIVCFVCALATDIAYWRTTNMMWADFSAWLIAVGLVVSVFAVLASLVDLFGDWRVRDLRSTWIHGLVSALVLALSILNILVHSRDAYTSVVPTGLILSGLVVLVLLVSTWSGWAMVYRDGVGVRAGGRL